MCKKTISLLLAAVLMVSISACGTGSKNALEQQNPSTYYNETEIGSNSDLMWPGGIRVNSKNQLVAFDRGDGTDTRFVTLDEDGSPVGQLKYSFSGSIRAFALDGQDNIYALTVEPRGGETLQRLEIVSSTGDAIKTIELGTVSNTADSGMQMQSAGFTDIAVDSDGYIYLASPSESIQMIDMDGQPVKTLGSKGYVSLDIDTDGSIIALSMTIEKSAIEKLDVSTGKIMCTVDLSSWNPTGTNVMSPGSNIIRFSKGDESIYHMTGQGITKYDFSGNLIGTAVDFKSHTILASGYNISDMAIDAEGNIYVTTTSVPAGGIYRNPKASASPARDVKYELYKYEIREGDSAAQNQKVITVSAPVSNRALEIAAGKFQKENPGYRIDIQTYAGGDYETYVKNLNTQILSGKGPDIISVAGLPYENYISRNILADLSKMMAADSSFDMNKYYTNIFDALRHNGKLYVLPTNFTFNVIMANQGILDRETVAIEDSNWTWDDFRKTAEKVTQKDGGGGSRAALPSVSSVELLNLFTMGSYSNFIDFDGKNANFNSPEFMDLLNTVKAFDDEGLTNPSVKNDMVSVLEAAGREAIVFYPYSITDYSMYGFMKAAFKEQLSLYNIPTAAHSTGGIFTLNSMYAINRNSQYKSESWEFLKILLSDDVQSQNMQGRMAQSQTAQQGTDVLSILTELSGFSVNKAAQQQKAQQVIDASQSGAMRMMISIGEGSISLSSAPLFQSDIDYINGFISELTTYANRDVNISSIVEDEVRAFFAGDKPVEETAKLIQERVSTYLRE